jgi:REP element-mobilizing transposase RayT
LKVTKDVPSLRSARLVAELERSWREVCGRDRFRLVHYSIQSDHVHMIVEAASARDLACGLKAIAASTIMWT